MKNILNKIEFHYSFLIMALGLVLTGHFFNLIAFTSLILIHEIGHCITSFIFKYKIIKIIIYPYGGLTELDTFINTDIYKDLIVAVSGIIMQCIYFIIIFYLYKNGIIREYIYNLFFLYHKSIVFFNILPILPLDGSKIVNLILSKYFNFNLSNKITVYISLFTMIFLLYSEYYVGNYSLLLSIGIIMQNIYRFYKQINYIYNRFLLERYLYDFNYKEKTIIYDKNKMFKNKSHFFCRKGRIFSEKVFLGIFFNKK